MGDDYRYSFIYPNRFAHNHMGAMAELKKLTVAKLMMDAGDEQIIWDGGASDYMLGNNIPSY